MKLTKQEKEMLLEALTAYENENYQSKDDNWQKKVNDLMDKIRKEI